MRSFLCLFFIPATLLFGGSARAADPENGQRLAAERCVSCHLAPGASREVRDAPSFESIAKKFGANPGLLAFALRDPHPRMNVMLTTREIEDVAAYINRLAD
jgi:mono/diheme cytochrome c family protein